MNWVPLILSIIAKATADNIDANAALHDAFGVGDANSIKARELYNSMLATEKDLESKSDDVRERIEKIREDIMGGD